MQVCGHRRAYSGRRVCLGTIGQCGANTVFLRVRRIAAEAGSRVQSVVSSAPSRRTALRRRHSRAPSQSELEKGVAALAVRGASETCPLVWVSFARQQACGISRLWQVSFTPRSMFKLYHWSATPAAITARSHRLRASFGDKLRRL